MLVRDGGYRLAVDYEPSNALASAARTDAAATAVLAAAHRIGAGP